MRFTVAQSTSQYVLCCVPMAVDCIGFDRRFLPAARELELGSVRKKKRDSHVDRAGRSIRHEKRIVGETGQLLPEERISDLVEHRVWRQKATLDNRSVTLERNDRWLSATASGLPSAMAILGNPAG